MVNAWQLYDDLIDILPTDQVVTGCIVSRFACVSIGAGTGLAIADAGGPRVRGAERQVVGRDLRSVAALAKSWDLELASVGVAAMNAWFNRRERVRAHRLVGGEADGFQSYADAVRGSRVVVIGRFAGLDRLSTASALTVLERRPDGDDLPDPACEYVLGDADHVFMTGMTLINKTMPRLLELARDARVVLVGPTAPFVPEVYGQRVAGISGSIVADADGCRSVVEMGGRMPELKPTLTRYNAVFDDLGVTLEA